MNEVVMHPVKSSQIKSVGYDTGRKALYIEFENGAVYEYNDVPSDHYNQMLIPTMSVGKYFYAEIKGKFEYVKMPYAVVEGKLHQI